MRNELLPESLDEFRERFGSFHDGGVHQVKLDLFSTQRHINPYVATIVVGTQDFGREAGDNTWVNLTFEIVDVRELRLVKMENYDFSVILDLNIAFFDDKIYLDVFSFSHIPTSPADFDRENDPKQLLIVGTRCFWSVSPYKQRELREW